MGTWSPKITSNDTFKDIYSDFIDIYNENKAISIITNKLKAKYQMVIDDPDEVNEYYFAVAKAQWDCGDLSKAMYEKVKRIIQGGEDIERWKRLGASTADLNKRKQCLIEFLTKITSPNLKPKKPKRKILRNSIFKKGDCLLIKMINNKYGLVIVLTEQEKSEWGLNLLLILDYYESIKPKESDFINGNCVMRKNLKGEYAPILMYCYQQNYRKYGLGYEKCCNLKITIKYDSQEGMYSYGRWDMIEKIIKYNAENKSSNIKSVKVKKMINRSFF